MGGKGSRQCYLDSKQEFCVYIPLNKKKKIIMFEEKLNCFKYKTRR